VAKFRRILLTGAAGRLGSELRKTLPAIAEIVRISDRVEMKEVAAHEEAVVCELGDYDAIMALTRDVDAIVHLGGIALEDKFEPILDANIRGGYHIYEGARKNGVKRIVFASSVHAIGYHALETHIDADSPTRPDSLYGVSKVYMEGLSRLYWDKFGIESVCLRIFSSFPEPTDRRQLWSWLSFADMCHHVERSLTAPRVGHTIAFAMSDNRHKPVDNSKAGHLGFAPKDNTEAYREAIEAKIPAADPRSPGVKFLGGWFCELGHPDDQ